MLQRDLGINLDPDYGLLVKGEGFLSTEGLHCFYHVVLHRGLYLTLVLYWKPINATYQTECP